MCNTFVSEYYAFYNHVRKLNSFYLWNSAACSFICSIKIPVKQLENSYFKAQKSVEDKALALYEKNPAEAVYFLNNYGIEKAQQMLARWKQLGWYLVVKYNDMVERPDRDGQFYYNENGLGQTIKRPGMPERFAREMNRHGGQRMKMPKK